MATARQIMAFGIMEAKGYSPEGSGAIIGNLSQESGAGLPSAFRHSNLDHGSQGLAQWRLDRLTNYQNYVRSRHPEAQDEQSFWAWCGNMALQLDFLEIELKHDYPALDVSLRRGGNIDDLTEAFCWKFERPSRTQSGIENRKKQARDVFMAASHINPSSPTTKTNTDIIKKEKSAVKNQQNGVGAVVLGLIVAALQQFAGMPHSMALVSWGIVGAVIIYSLFAAQKAQHEADITATNMKTGAPTPLPGRHGHWEWVDDPLPPPPEPAPASAPIPPLMFLSEDINRIAGAV